MQRFVDHDVGAEADQVGGSGKARRAGAHDRHLAERILDHRRQRRRRMGVVTDEALDAADADRFQLAALVAYEDALRLALVLLRTDAAADRGEDARLVDRLQRAIDIAHQNLADEGGNIDADRAARDAGRLGALDAALRFAQRVGDRVAEVHFLEVLRALMRVALRHLHLVGLERGEFLVVALTVDDELLFDGADMVEIFVGPGFLLLEALLAGQQLLEVDLMAVEVGPVDAGELHLAADGDAARAAHAGAVHHDRVEGDHGLDPERPRRLDAGIHHRHRADRDDEVGLVVFQHVLQRGGDEAGPAVAAVIGADQQVVGIVAEFVFPEHEVLVAEAHDGGGAIAGRLEAAQLRIDRSNAEAAADQHDVADLPDVLRQAERADEVLELVALLEVVAHLVRRLPEGLHDQGDGAAFAVIVGDRQRNALAAIVKAQHHEVSGKRGVRDVGGVDLPQEGGVGKGFAANDWIHSSPQIGRAWARLLACRTGIRPAATGVGPASPGITLRVGPRGVMLVHNALRPSSPAVL